jgi:hypothetical protein
MTSPLDGDALQKVPATHLWKTRSPDDERRFGEAPVAGTQKACDWYARNSASTASNVESLGGGGCGPGVRIRSRRVKPSDISGLDGDGNGIGWRIVIRAPAASALTSGIETA